MVMAACGGSVSARNKRSHRVSRSHTRLLLLRSDKWPLSADMMMTKELFLNTDSVEIWVFWSKAELHDTIFSESGKNRDESGICVSFQKQWPGFLRIICRLKSFCWSYFLSKQLLFWVQIKQLAGLLEEMHKMFLCLFFNNIEEEHWFLSWMNCVFVWSTEMGTWTGSDFSQLDHIHLLNNLMVHRVASNWESAGFYSRTPWRLRDLYSCIGFVQLTFADCSIFSLCTASFTKQGSTPVWILGRGSDLSV